MLFSSIYSAIAEDYEELRNALDRLNLNNSSLVYQPDDSTRLGFGFRCGFLGLLHIGETKSRQKTYEAARKSRNSTGGILSDFKGGLIMLEGIHLTKDFGNVVAVKDLNLKVEKELFVFLGPNGAGKTTTIKMMTGLLKPTTGTVKIHGYDLHQQAIEAKRFIGLVPETPFLYQKLTGREFLTFMADLYRIDRAVSSKRLNDLIELFDLVDKADDMIESYSHGMQRKCAIGGALIHDPKVLFLDEPTVGLDPKSARNLKDVLVGLVERGVTVFMSTHILEIAESMCDRVGIIHKGELIACGKIEDLKKKFRKKDHSLEDIFLELTEGKETKQVLKYLDS